LHACTTSSPCFIILGSHAFLQKGITKYFDKEDDLPKLLEEETEDDDDKNNSDTAVDDFVEQSMERVLQDQEEGEIDDTTEESENLEKDKEAVIWFAKLKPLIDHIQEVNYTLLLVLGTISSLDEMMI